MVNYLHVNNVLFLDFAVETRITQEHFKDAYHMNKEGQIFFTEILAEELNKILP